MAYDAGEEIGEDRALLFFGLHRVRSKQPKISLGVSEHETFEGDASALALAEQQPLAQIRNQHQLVTIPVFIDLRADDNAVDRLLRCFDLDNTSSRRERCCNFLGLAIELVLRE